MGSVYQESETPLARLRAASPGLLLTAASLGWGARLAPAGTNPCKRRQERGPALLGPALKPLRKCLSVLAPLTEGFYGDVQI